MTVHMMTGNTADAAVCDFYAVTLDHDAVLLLETGCYLEAQEGYGTRMRAMLDTLGLVESGK